MSMPQGSDEYERTENPIDDGVIANSARAMTTKKTSKCCKKCDGRHRNTFNPILGKCPCHTPSQEECKCQGHVCTPRCDCFCHTPEPKNAGHYLNVPWPSKFMPPEPQEDWVEKAIKFCSHEHCAEVCENVMLIRGLLEKYEK